MLSSGGNNRQAIFASEDDMKAYVTWLKQYRKSKFKAALTPFIPFILLRWKRRRRTILRQLIVGV
jgi:hypothetical protein